MRRQLVLSALVLGWVAVANAQTPTSPPSAPSSGPERSDPGPSRLKGADAQKLIGRTIMNAQNEKVGEIKSIHLDHDGVVDAVIVSVGGFLGMGDREAALTWKDITVSDNGEKVATSLTKEQLQNLPPYRYADPAQRGTAFRDRPSPPDAKSPTVATTPPQPRAGFNTGGDVSGSGIVRASVRNPAGESIGSVEEVLLTADGTVKSVIVSVGGFLGVGSKRVAMQWKDFKIWQDKDTLTLVTEATKADLKSAPDYKAEGR